MYKKENPNYLRRVRRGARKTNDTDLIKLVEYFEKESKFFGTSKNGARYQEKVANSMARYIQLAERRANLFAIIMPAGHGKTTLAHRYGLVDVDMLISAKEHEYFIAKRIAIMNGTNTWSGHNSEWFERMNKTLDLLDYSRPVILLAHHEEIAHELGAQIMGAIQLDELTFESNISRRDDMSRFFSRESYKNFKVSTYIDNIFHVSSNEALEKIFLDIINANGLPIACPQKFSMEYRNPHYKRNVPGWILRGERAGDETVNIKMLVDMFECNMIPKECVDYYVRNSYAVTSFDFGISMFEWVNELAKIPPVMNDAKDFDKDGDFNIIFPPRSQKELTRANVTIRRMTQTFDILSYDDAMMIAKHHVGEPQVFVASLLAEWKGVTQFTNVAHMVLPWFKINFMHWVKNMKNLHSLIRTSRFFMNTEITESDRQALMYMDLLVGRAEYIIDELSEVTKRGGGSYESKHLSYDPERKLFTNNQYKTDFNRAIHIAYSRMRLNPRKINFKSFKDFYNSRRSWLTKGSLVYNKMPPSMKKYSGEIYNNIYNIILEVEGRHNKQSLFEIEDIGRVLHDIREKDVNVTKTMIKYETGGKERVLLPGSLVHFIVFTYVLELAERQAQVGSVRLNAMSDDDIRYFDKKMGTGLYHVLYDWADFNEQHSADEMAAVIKGLNESVAAPEDYSLFVEAISSAMYNMALEDREGKRHKIWNGLYSGWRGTTWINTVLNFCYVSICLLNYERIYGKHVTLMVDHGGDDMDLMVSDPTALPQILQIMDDMLFNSNAWKQMLGDRSEFFRNTIAGSTVYASPTRALASFMAGDWEGSGQATVRERVVSLLDQVGKLRRRGVSNEMCQGITMCAISHWCKIKEGDEWLNLPQEVLHGRIEDNGLGIPDRDNKVWILQERVPEINEEWYKLIVPDYKSSKDYINVLAKELSNFEIIISRREELAQKMAKDAFDVEKKIDYQAWKEILKFSTKVIGKQNVIEEKVDEFLFEGFMEFELTEELENKYQKAGRFTELYQYLSYNNRPIDKEELVNLMSEGTVKLEALEFSGDIYYRRLVPEFIALRATYYCREAINLGLANEEEGMEIFRTICYMSKEVFGHKL